MITLKNIKLAPKQHEFEYPGDRKFHVTVAYLPKVAMRKLRDESTKVVWRQGRQVEELQEAPFYAAYSKATVLGWQGLTVGTLKALVPVELAGAVDDTEEVPYSQEMAEFLLLNSKPFDQWVTGLQDNLEAFVEAEKEATRKNLQPTPSEKQESTE